MPEHLLNLIACEQFPRSHLQGLDPARKIEEAIIVLMSLGWNRSTEDVINGENGGYALGG